MFFNFEANFIQIFCTAVSRGFKIGVNGPVFLWYKSADFTLAFNNHF